MALLKPRKHKGQTGAAMPTISASEERIIRLADVIDRVGIKRAMIYKLIALDKFPTQRKIGRASGWKLSEINAWVAGTWTPAKEASQ